ncbi:MAG TPA: patatin-like phospholipase family protein [Methylomirabilota bacterium]|nr:patatin-like phospholipase family protein [Methylomirabilota bacterium]
MSPAARSALVLQGGGALGAYELGAARRLYQDAAFAPDVIAGVSIGAITAVLLARPARGRRPLQALEEFWQRVTVSDWLVPPPLRPIAVSLLGNRHFFVPRSDVLTLPNWTNIYDTAPLRQTLAELVDRDALADPLAVPQLLVTATDVEAGQIRCFHSRDGKLGLEHIVASGSLPPSFAMTKIESTYYWDGGLFDNTPLGAVLDMLDDGPGVNRTVYVVNLFPNKAPLPRSMPEVLERMLNLQFANKTREDLKLMCRFDEVAQLMEALESLPKNHALRNHPAFRAVKKRGYVRVPRIVPITRPEQAGGFDGSDFSPETIRKRADEGYAATDRALALPQDASPCAELWPS